MGEMHFTKYERTLPDGTKSIFEIIGPVHNEYLVKISVGNKKQELRVSELGRKAFLERFIKNEKEFRIEQGKHVSGGRSQVRIKINPHHHALSEHGYTHVVNMPVDKRHRILRKVLKFLQEKYGERQGFRKLIEQMTAAQVLLEHSKPRESRVFEKDRDWVSGLYEKFKGRL